MMSPKVFKGVMETFQQIVYEHGASSELVAEALDEMRTLFGNKEMTDEHRQIMSDLGMLPKLSVDPIGNQFITREAWAEWYGVSVDAVDDKLRQWGLLPPKTDFELEMERYWLMADQFGENSVKAFAAFVKAMALAPQEFRDAVDAAFNECFELPNPVGVDDDGRPLYKLDEIADMLDISIGEAEEKLFEIEGEIGHALRHTGQLNQLH
ncbi:MAG: hypothetical protein ACXV7J_09840 [Methylomonas sp.]